MARRMRFSPACFAKGAEVIEKCAKKEKAMTHCINSNVPDGRTGSRRPKKAGLLLLFLVAVGLATLIGLNVTREATAEIHTAKPVATSAAAAAPLPANDPAFDYATGLSKVFRHAADRVMPSVVTIQRTAIVKSQSSAEPRGNGDDRGGQLQPFGELFNDPLFKRFFGDDLPSFPGTPLPDVPSGPQLSMGSGVIIDSSGVILTNNHVVEGGGKVMVRLHDGREFEAAEVKTDPKTDLAVVRIKDAGTLPAAQLGDSGQLQVGDWVIAVGDPFGLAETVTAGIISAKGRGIGITAREEFLQTDAAINPGNSGGPLVNLRGEVVGINTAITSRSGGFQGIGFAIPVNLAKWVSGQLIERGTVTRAYLGVGIQQVTPELASQLGLKETGGTVVTEVRANSPAGEAGVKTGDVVVEFGGHAIHNAREIQAFVEKSPVGSKQPLTVIRDGKRMTLNVTVREQPKDYGLARNDVSAGSAYQGETYEQLGIEISNITPEVADQLGLQGAQGVVITSVRSGSLAQLAGLSTSMVIERVGQKPVKTVDDFRAAMKDQSLAKGVLLLVRSREGSRFVVIKDS